jgi:hypothetical protein
VSEVDVRERGGELNVAALAFLSTHRRAGSPWMSWVASGRHAALVKPARSGPSGCAVWAPMAVSRNQLEGTPLTLTPRGARG